MQRSSPWAYARPQLLLYLDTNVLAAIADQAAGSQIKKFLKARGAKVFGSIQNLAEALRKPDPAERERLVRTILQVCRDHEVTPVHLRAVMAAVAEMRRHHPDWLTANPDLRAIGQTIQYRRHLWERLKGDPLYVPPNIANDSFVRSLVGKSKERQAVRRNLELAGKSLPSPMINPAVSQRLQPLVDALPPPEAYWRQQTGAAWWNGAVMGSDQAMLDLRDWLLPYLLVEHLDPEAWMRFWLAEADADALAISRVEGLLDHFQTKVEASKWGDINHAGCAVRCDMLLTADQTFYRALVKVREQPSVSLAAPVLLDRAAPDILAVITAALG